MRVDWSVAERRVMTPESNQSLQAIIKHSLFRSERALLHELRDMKQWLSDASSGTKIIIYNLKRVG